MGTHVEVLFKTIRALEVEEWQTAAQISKRSGVPLMSTYRQLRDLVDVGAVERCHKTFIGDGPHTKPTYGWRRTIIFKGERGKDKW